MSGRYKNAEYREISTLGINLRNDKVRVRRQAGVELIKKLSDRRLRDRLAEEAAVASASNLGGDGGDNGRKAICSMWRILINNAIHSAVQVMSKKKNIKVTKQDIELPFHLLRICDGSIKEHNNLDKLASGLGSKMSKNEISALLEYCFDMLLDEKALEVAHKELLSMFEYLLSSPHYVVHFCPKNGISDCLAEIENNLFSTSLSPDLLSIVINAFAGLIRVCTCTLRIGMHKYLHKCIKIVSDCFSATSQSQFTLTLESKKKIFTVAINLMAAHPEQAIASIEQHGRDMFIFARKCYISTHGNSYKDVFIDYFSVHL